jgi:hypothetical protein
LHVGEVTDAQFTLLLSALLAVGGVIAGALKWAVGRVTVALEKNSDAFTMYASTLAVQAETLRRVEEWCDEHTGVVTSRPKPPSEPPPVPKTRTPVRGTPIVERFNPRGRSEGGDR